MLLISDWTDGSTFDDYLGTKSAALQECLNMGKDTSLPSLGETLANSTTIGFRAEFPNCSAALSALI